MLNVVHVPSLLRRFDCREPRYITLGFLSGRMVVVGWTPRRDDCHVFSMRKANDREVKNTRRTSRDARRKPGSDLARVDAHVIAPREYDELPEITDAQMERAVLSKGAIVLPNSLRARGRPRKEVTKIHQGLRLSRDVLAAFRATGPGWQTRIDNAQRQWLKEHA